MSKQEKELADNFAKLIQTARENKGWTQAQLGQRMAETVNVIKSAESGKPPADSVIKKFEMILGIELMVEASSDHQSMIGQSSNSRGMTIGDYLKDLR
ncbi:MAG: helix-turn-helix domain-containing protein [Candidatus Poseidoniaceae archaeon]